MNWPAWASKDPDEQRKIERTILTAIVAGVVALFGAGMIAGYFLGLAHG